MYVYICIYAYICYLYRRKAIKRNLFCLIYIKIDAAATLYPSI